MKNARIKYDPKCNLKTSFVSKKSASRDTRYCDDSGNMVKIWGTLYKPVSYVLETKTSMRCVLLSENPYKDLLVTKDCKPIARAHFITNFYIADLSKLKDE